MPVGHTLGQALTYGNGRSGLSVAVRLWSYGRLAYVNMEKARARRGSDGLNVAAESLQHGHSGRTVPHEPDIVQPAFP